MQHGIATDGRSLLSTTSLSHMKQVPSFKIILDCKQLWDVHHSKTQCSFVARIPMLIIQSKLQKFTISGTEK